MPLFQAFGPNLAVGDLAAEHLTASEGIARNNRELHLNTLGASVMRE
jgi:hypothetical protein